MMLLKVCMYPPVSEQHANPEESKEKTSRSEAHDCATLVVRDVVQRATRADLNFCRRTRELPATHPRRTE